jgi:hypothetical protein
MGICVNTTYALKEKHTPTSGLKFANVIFESMLAPYPIDLSTTEYGRSSKV